MDKRNGIPIAHCAVGSNYVQILDTHPFYATIAAGWVHWPQFHSATGITAISFAIKYKGGTHYLTFGPGENARGYSDRRFWRDYLITLCEYARDHSPDYGIVLRLREHVQSGRLRTEDNLADVIRKLSDPD